MISRESPPLWTACGALAPTLIVVEATGGYENRARRGVGRRSAPGRRSESASGPRLCEATGQLAKTDRLDAQLIALFAERVHPDPRPLPDAVLQQLEALITRRRQLLDMLTAEGNCLEHAAAPTRREITRHIRWLERRIAAVDRDLDETIRRVRPGVRKEYCSAPCRA
jgi:transposase